MALADFFKKKRPEYEEPIPGAPPPPEAPRPAAPLPSEVPISQVLDMQSQGLSNNQIIEGLQRQGYNPQQIYDALAQAEAKKTIEPMRPVVKPEVKAKPKQNFEQVAEQIVEEKWGEFQKEMGKMREWKDSVDTRLDKFEQSVEDMRADLESLHKAIVDRIGEYDKSLTDVGTEIKAMEKVFQKVLPELTSNVQELSRITKKAKQ